MNFLFHISKNKQRFSLYGVLFALLLLVGHSFTPHSHRSACTSSKEGYHTHKIPQAGFLNDLYSPNLGENHLSSFIDGGKEISFLQSAAKYIPISFPSELVFSITWISHLQKVNCVCFYANTIKTILFKTIPLRAPPVIG